METTNNIKKAFPIASIFFLLYAILSLSKSALSAAQSYPTYISMGMPIDSVRSNIIISLVGAVIAAIPFILMGIFSLNTAKKPNIGYIIASALSCLLALLVIPSSITALSVSDFSENYRMSRILTLVAFVLFFFALVVALLYAILIKASKKPSKISALWPVFSAPFVLHFIVEKIGGYYGSLYAAENSELYQFYDTPINPALSTITSIVAFLAPVMLVAAFIFVALQFAKVNKNLATKKETETV